MSNSRLPIALTGVVLMLVLVSCSKDPQAQYKFHMSRADKYVQQNKLPEALVEYASAIKADGKSSDAQFRLGMIALRLRQYQRAYQALSKAVELDPNNMEARARLAELFAEARSYDRAEKEVQVILDHDPSSAVGHRLMGMISLARNKPQEAVAEFRTALESAPKDPTLAQQLALAEMASGNSSSAESSFQHAIEMNPRRADSYLTLAQYYQTVRRPADAEAALVRGVTAVGNPVRLQLALANLYFRDQQPDKAEQVIAAARQHKKDAPLLELAVGDLYAGLGKNAEAVDAYRRVVDEQPKNYDLQSKIVEGLISLGRYDEAQQFNDKILEKKKKDSTAILNRGRILLASRKLPEATAAFKEAVAQSGDSADAHYYLGLVLEGTGSAAQARSELEKAASLNQRHLLALLELGRISLRNGDPDGAAKYAERILKIAPSNAPAQIIMGDANLARRNPTEALKNFQLAMKTAPTAGALERIGAAFLAQGDWNNAQKALEAVLTANPNYTPALTDIVNYWFSQKQAKKAEQRIQQQISKSPKNPEFYYMLAQVQSLSAQWDTVRDTLLHALSLKPDYLEATRMLSRVYLTQKNPAEAMKVLSNAPNGDYDVQTQVLLGGMYESQRDWSNAMKRYERALQIDASVALAANNLAYLYSEHGGDMDRALTLAQTANQLVPGNPDIADTLAWIYYKREHYGLALPLLADAAKKAPENAAVQLHLGLTLYKTGDKAHSRQELEHAVKGNLSADQAQLAKTALAEMQKN